MAGNLLLLLYVLLLYIRTVGRLLRDLNFFIVFVQFFFSAMKIVSRDNVVKRHIRIPLYALGYRVLLYIIIIIPIKGF